MKIAFVCPHFYPHIGGVETVVFELASNFAALGHSVTVLTLSYKKEQPKTEKLHNFTIKRFCSVGIGKLMVSFELLAYLHKNSTEFDVIHAHNYHSFPALSAALTKKTPLIFSPHYHGTGRTLFTHLLHYPYRILGKFIFSRCDAVLCDTQAESESLKKHFFIKSLAVIPLGIDAKAIQKTKKDNKAPEYILSVGRLEKYKNIELIIRSLPFTAGNVQLKIIGEGPSKQDLYNVVEELGLASRISFVGNVSNDQLYQLLRSAKAFVTMSQIEAYGLSLLEAAAAKIGIVASNIPAYRELVEKFRIKNVIFLKLDSTAKSLAKAIEVALQKPSQATRDLPSWKFVAIETLKHYNL